jgi:predicted ATPase/DNA-binding winged helix-turn-helix (wHTH) protein
MGHTQTGDIRPIRIEPDTGWAWRGDERLDLTPKAFAVLRYLVEHPQHLITKDDLLDAVWGDAVVSEAAITSCIRDLRRALDDSSQTPRYIETVHRRGFRFIGPVAAPSAPSMRPTVRPSPLVGRDAELARLDAVFATAAAGRRRLVFVTGEAGIGKTSLVETFLGRLDGADLRIGRGQCVEQYGASEAYLPLLEALGRLGREPRGAALVQVLKQHAPTWLGQLPALLSDVEVDAVQRRAQGTTRERMLREMIEALDALTLDVPLVLVLEDLHWSDAATVDLLALLARRRDAARLLIIGTYRPAELELGAHQLKAAKQELEVHGLCEEVALHFLGEDATREYLGRRFPDATFPRELGRVLHANTGGNPLFLVNVVDYLVARDDLREGGAGWELTVPVEGVASGIPDTLWQMVDKQVDRLTAQEQVTLAVGSVAGAEFSAALATADAIAVDDAERVCDALVRRGLFLRAAGVAEWPDGTVAGRYAFIHALYRNVIYARIAIGHRVGLHVRIGARLELAHGARAADIAGELAMHFEQGRDIERAVRYRRDAMDTALRQHAYREAVHHATRALELLRTWPETTERDQNELAIQTALGAAVIATSGWASPDVATAYARARELCAGLGVTPRLYPVLIGLCGFYLMRGELRVANEVSRQLMAHAETIDDPQIRLGAHNVTGLGLFYGGDFVEAMSHFERAAALHDPHRPRQHRQFSVDHDPGVSCGAHTALGLMVLGYQDRATIRMRDCLAEARAIDHPLTLTMAYNFASVLHQFRRERHVVQELEDVRDEYAAKHDFDLFRLLGQIYRGWLAAEDGGIDEGLEQIRYGVMTFQAIGAELGRPTFLGILADVCGRAGRRDEALDTVRQAIAAADETGLHYWDAELRRLRGSLLLAGDTSDETMESEAEVLFREAIDLARGQRAKAFELRAAMDLARLWRRRKKTADARALLAGVFGWFTEGFGTPDLVDAKALLEELGS